MLITHCVDELVARHHLATESSLDVLLVVADSVEPASCALRSDNFADDGGVVNDADARPVVSHDDNFVTDLESHVPFFSVGISPDNTIISSSV